MKKVFAVALCLILAIGAFSYIVTCKEFSCLPNDTTPPQIYFEDPGNKNTVTENVDVYERTKIIMTVDSNDWTKNGEVMNPLDSSPIIIAGHTMVPLRAIVEALGGTVEWDSISKAMYITLGEDLMAMIMNNPMVLVNGVPFELDFPPTIVEGRTLVPLRFVGEYFGCEIDWDVVTSTVTLTRVILPE